jgi:hypothetical protein
VPAGYLPAPKQARFISEAEQAAEALPPTIKAPSLKNALLKGGAKPLELEYAGIDDFISQNQGKPVSAADVLAHLQTEGPLGKLKRVEQQVTGGRPASNDMGGDGIPFGLEDLADPGQKPPAYALDVRAPFDPSAASDQTRHHSYTVPGKRGDFTGYREVLMEDPKNSSSTDGRMIPADSEIAGPVDAHRADYWTRYNEYPDRIAVQNIQSDVGQNYTKGETNQGQLEGMNAHLQDLQRRTREIAEEITQTPRGHGAISRLEFELSQTEEQINEILELAENHRFQINREANGDHSLFQDSLPVSPIAKDGNWKNLMARHIALQSINGGGKPITIPTGKQMVDVEGFGMATHGNEIDAAKAATDFNTDLVRRLQKIFRGLHPDGASVTSHALDNARDSMGPIVSGRGKTAEINDIWYSMMPDLEDMDRHFMDKSELRTHGNKIGRNFEPHEELESGLHTSSNADQMIYRLATDRDQFLEPDAVSELERLVSQNPSPEMMQAAMKQIQTRRLLNEMGPPPTTMGYFRNFPDASNETPSPGWTIKPSPMAVRQALEKGLPIMSLLPLLLAPREKK